MNKYVESNKLILRSKLFIDLSKDIVSLLNANGGEILIGIEEDGTVIGVKNIDSIFTNIVEIITTQIEPNPKELIKTELLFRESKTIICINISKVINSIFCLKEFGFSSSGCLIRIENTFQEMTQEQIQLRTKRLTLETDALVTSPTQIKDFSFRILKIYYSKFGPFVDEVTFEKNLFLKNNENEFNKLAELLTDENTIPLVFEKFKGINEKK